MAKRQPNSSRLKNKRLTERKLGPFCIGAVLDWGPFLRALRCVEELVGAQSQTVWRYSKGRTLNLKT